MATLPVGDPLPAPELHPAAVAVLSLAGVDATPEDQQALCYRAIEKLRLWHNEQGDRTRLKPADPQFLKLAEFREWARKEWEPRHKAAYLALSSLPDYSTLVPLATFAAQRKKMAGLTLTAGEISLVKTVDDREALRVAGVAAIKWDTQIDPEKFPKLGVLGEPPDPLENFSTYTKVDDNNRLTLGTSQLDFTNLADSETAYAYKDKGASHFAANFTHLVKQQYSTAIDGHGRYIAQWGVSNTVATYDVLIASGGHSLFGSIWANNSHQLWIGETIGNETWNYSYSTIGSVNTPYWAKFVRDEAVGTYGTLYGYWYTDSDRTNLLSALSITLREKADFRYLFGFNTFVFDYPATCTGFAADLDLGEATATPWLYARRQTQFIGGGFG